MFGGEKIMMPERKGNRLTAGADNEQVKALGWKQQHSLKDWIQSVKKEVGEIQKTEQRVLVFSTTFYPHAGQAELALCDLMRAMPNVAFDVVTTRFSKDTMGDECDIPNVNLHRVGFGSKFDKYLLPFVGGRSARALTKEHDYMFRWSLFASYGALAAFFSGFRKKPLLITLADQKLANIPFHTRFILRRMLGAADQVFAMSTDEAQAAISLFKRTTLIKSIGKGDAFANQVRIAYSKFLNERMEKQQSNH